MHHVSVIVQKAQLHNFLVYAGQEKVLHLITAAHKNLPEGAEGYDASSVLARSSALRNRTVSLSSTLIDASTPIEQIDAPIQDLEALATFLENETTKLEEIVRETDESSAKLQAESERARELARLLKGLESIGVPLTALDRKGFLTMIAGEVDKKSLEGVHRALGDVTYGNLIFAVTGSSEETVTFLAAFPSPFQEEAVQTATGSGAKLESSWKDLPAEAGDARNVVDSRVEELERSSKQMEHQRKVRANELGPRTRALNTLSEVLEIRARALSGSSTTQATCMLQAWVPEDMVQQLEEGAKKACGGLVSIHIESGADHDSSSSPEMEHREGRSPSTPPTLIRVPTWTQPLQSIINNFGIPSYNEINPLPFMIISYPLIYGMMFGDFGQGPLFILFGLLFLRLKRSGAKVPMGDIGQLIVGSAELMILLGIGITIFGFVFGDFFGFESATLFGFHGLFSPTEGALERDISHLRQFMAIVLYFGVAHYTLGLGLSAYMKVRRREYSEAFFGPVCWAWFYLMLVYSVRQFILGGYDFSVFAADPLSIALDGFLLLPLFLLGWKEGGLHALEVFTSAGSNTLSYLRIWALNIADFFVKVSLFTAFGIVGAVMGNLLVLLIEGLIVFVQTLRLHWVEWFSKFYEGSGVAFAPYQEPTRWIVPIRG